MSKFLLLTSSCFLLPFENIDTDQIIPAQFLKITKKEGLGKYLFYNWKKNKQFESVNYQNAKILIAGNNFGCGSSREHAVWALKDYGFKAIISSSFGEIFYHNCFKNGLVPIVINPKQLKRLFYEISKNPSTKLTINLKKQKIGIPSRNISFHFSISSFNKLCLLEDIDELGYILTNKAKINSYEKNHRCFTR